jgi:outer membrane protein OmpA-like peptidoglycan-associated protein
MASNIVNTYSDLLFDLYNRANDPSKKGSQNGWPYCETEIGLRIFQEAAEPAISRTTQGATPSSPLAPPLAVGQRSRPTWPQSVWLACLGALVVICCVVALAWQAHRQALANARLERQEAENAKTWREAAQQLAQGNLAELRVLNSNQVAFAAGQARIGDLLARLGATDTQLAALASTQADATRQLAAAQTALAQETTNLLASLRQTVQQGLEETASQSHADTIKLQTQVAESASNLLVSVRQTLKQGLAEVASQSRSDTVKLQTQVKELAASQSHAETIAIHTQVAEATSNLLVSLRQTLQQGFAKAASQSHSDTVKLQTQIAELAAGQKVPLDRLSGPTNAPNFAFGVPGVRMKTFGKAILLTFDEGLFAHGTYFKADAKSRLRAVAKALAQVSTPLRIELIGCADDECTPESWTARFEESLALDRATAVANYFIELGLLAPRSFAALSGGATNRPFPSDTAQNRASNRTVVLRVWTEEKPTEGHQEPAP